MKLALLRLAALLILGSQLLPVGLPLLCRQFRQVATAGCGQQMPSRHSAAVTATSEAGGCAISALCAAPWGPALAHAAVTARSVQPAHVVAFVVLQITSGDPQPPLPPPPQA